MIEALKIDPSAIPRPNFVLDLGSGIFALAKQIVLMGILEKRKSDFSRKKNPTI